MRRPKVDDELTLETESGRTKAICAEVKDDPMHPDGSLVRAMARGPFVEGEQCWIVDRDGSKTGATVRGVAKLTVDSEVSLAAIFD